MVRTTILMTIGVCAAAFLLLGVRRRQAVRHHRTATRAAVEPVAAAPGAPVAAGAPGAVDDSPIRARRRDNSGAGHFARAGGNARGVRGLR